MELPSPLTSVAGIEKTCGHCTSKESVSVSCWAPLIFNLLKHCVIIAIKTTVPCFSLMISLMFIDNKRRLSLCGFQCPLSPSHRVRKCYSIRWMDGISLTCARACIHIKTHSHPPTAAHILTHMHWYILLPVADLCFAPQPLSAESPAPASSSTLGLINEAQMGLTSRRDTKRWKMAFWHSTDTGPITVWRPWYFNQVLCEP